MSNIELLEPIDLSDQLHDMLKGKKFIGVTEDCNGRAMLLKNMINKEQAIYLLTMAINNIMRCDSLDTECE